LYLCFYRGTCDWAGRSNMGVYFRDLSKQAPCRGAGAGFIYSLDLCRIADDVLSKNGNDIFAGNSVPFLLHHDGAAVGLGEGNGAGDQTA